MTHGTPDFHIPVLAERAADLLVTSASGVYVDGTLGGGGHAERILERLSPQARLIAFDQDLEAIEHARRRLGHDPRVTIVHESTTRLLPILAQLDIGNVNGILLDLGVSSRHLDNPERGFSHRVDGPLDMRMDRRATVTAADILAEASREELERIFREYGEEPHARLIADAVVQCRAVSPLTRTVHLVRVVRSCVHGGKAPRVLARIFQALRIAVNRELEALSEMLAASIEALQAGGRLVVISYHSLEDRPVKEMLRREAARCTCPPRIPLCVCGVSPRMRILTPKPIRPDADEIRNNPRARSARLRAGEKLLA
ncbi:MAG: 16S rRNA (cytosine(1402)-N(4))-methyltransferase RsmH [Bacteroidota bacterium]|nr:16S rRNA (cytosine(1402)-N(4))-methyltransferase RsmH [Bacteroidota bacterium]